MSDETYEAPISEIQEAYAKAQEELFRLDQYVDGEWRPFRDRLSRQTAEDMQAALHRRTKATYRIVPSAIAIK